MDLLTDRLQVTIAVDGTLNHKPKKQTTVFFVTTSSSINTCIICDNHVRYSAIGSLSRHAPPNLFPSPLALQEKWALITMWRYNDRIPE